MRARASSGPRPARADSPPPRRAAGSPCVGPPGAAASTPCSGRSRRRWRAAAASRSAVAPAPAPPAGHPPTSPHPRRPTRPAAARSRERPEPGRPPPNAIAARGIASNFADSGDCSREGQPAGCLQRPHTVRAIRPRPRQDHPRTPRTPLVRDRRQQHVDARARTQPVDAVAVTASTSPRTSTSWFGGPIYTTPVSRTWPSTASTTDRSVSRLSSSTSRLRCSGDRC